MKQNWHTGLHCVSCWFWKVNILNERRKTTISSHKKLNTFQKQGTREPFFFFSQESYSQTQKFRARRMSKDTFLFMYYCFLPSLSDSLIYVSHPKEIHCIDWEADGSWCAPWGPHHLCKISVSWKPPLKVAKPKMSRGKDLQNNRFPTVCIAFPGHHR